MGQRRLNDLAGVVGLLVRSVPERRAETMRSVPLLIILGIGVLVITYVPWLTLGLLELVGRQ